MVTRFTMTRGGKDSLRPGQPCSGRMTHGHTAILFLVHTIFSIHAFTIVVDNNRKLLAHPLLFALGFRHGIT